MPYRKIYTSSKKHCLDIASGDKTNGLPLISYPCHNGPNQKFSYKKKTKQFVIKSSKKCLDVVKDRVFQNKCNTRKISQKWKYNRKTRRILSMKNKKCLDVSENKYHMGPLITYPCHNGPNQKFHI